VEAWVGRGGLCVDMESVLRNNSHRALDDKPLVSVWWCVSRGFVDCGYCDDDDIPRPSATPNLRFTLIPRHAPGASISGTHAGLEAARQPL
jgi:hypothetical protein